MKIQKEEVSDCRYSLLIEVPAETVNKRLEEVYSRLLRTAEVPGFRKGKVPRDVIASHFKDHIRDEVIGDILPDAYDKAIAETKLMPVSSPQFTDVKFEENQPVSFKASVDVRPSFSLPRYFGIEVEKEVPVVNAEEVNNVLEYLRQRHAVFTPVENRPVQKDDIVRISFEGKVDGRPLKGVKSTDRSLQVGAGVFPADFENGLIGMKPGEEKEIKVSFPGDSQIKEVAGKESVFHVAVREIREKHLPEIDNDFAEEAGGCKTPEELKQKLEEDILKEKTARVKAEAINKIVLKIVEATTMSLPQSLVEHEAEHVLNDSVRRLLMQGVPKEDIQKHREELLKECRVTAEKKIKAELIIEEIIEKEKIQVSEEEIKQEIADLKTRLDERSRKKQEEYLDSEAGWNEVQGHLLIQKALGMLFTEAKIILAKGE